MLAMCLMSFQQFDSIPERIEHVYSVETVERLVNNWRESGCRTPRGELLQVTDEKRWVRLPSRPKFEVDAKMDTERTASKPHATTCGEIRWLRLLHQTQNSSVKGSRHLLLPGRHCQLDVIKAEDLAHRDTIRQSDIGLAGQLDCS